MTKKQKENTPKDCSECKFRCGLDCRKYKERTTLTGWCKAGRKR